ncbi:uncharacterized protein [Chelonus insularis]|uniref:uncharacterized protein n=1 Tax=Chelonus insularis TaxID=460826 RepID=UPI00158C0084|nr:uncharacterized protein LOC118066556 [Chelonus insularis]XP_034938570.1 uncharacterized protein LOC118066556 [Chelonus insularis]
MAKDEPRRRTIMLVGDTESFTPYGLDDDDLLKISSATKTVNKFANRQNGVKIYASPMTSINTLGDLGYHVISTTYMSKSDKLVWMLERNKKEWERPEIEPPFNNDALQHSLDASYLF